MNSIVSIGPIGTFIILLQAGLFMALVKASSDVHTSTRPLIKGLSRSLAELKDNFGDEDNIVTRARTRYRRALEQIEKVDTGLITSSMLSYTEVTKILGIRLKYTDFDQFYRSGPSTLITLGLLGTFVGLTGNLDELSSILNAAESSPAEGLLRASAILQPMATAFVSSLVAVSLSIVLWLIGTARSTHTLVADLNELMGAYLDQVVQANSKRYSLMRESLERMEKYLTAFLSAFSDTVGSAIERAMQAKISQVFDSIVQSAHTYARYVDFLDQGGEQLKIAGRSFEKASKIFATSSFASDFAVSTESFLRSSTVVSDSSRQLANTSRSLQERLQSISESCESGSAYFKEMNTSLTEQVDIVNTSLQDRNETMTVLSDATKQLREARLAVGREARANEKLVSSVASGFDVLQNGMVSLMSSLDTLNNTCMNRDRKTIQTLKEITDVNAELASTFRSDLRSIADDLASTIKSTNPSN